jgi:S-disulfanyl-L-cysteine oxidoreductase SoxD
MQHGDASMGRSILNVFRTVAAGLVCAYLCVTMGVAEGRSSLQAGVPAGVSIDGSYTEAQARRGKKLSDDNCAACHGEDLSGAGFAPSLAGEGFLTLWQGRTVADLYDRIRTTMPAQAAGSLTNQEYLDIVAFLLQANSIRAGDQELTNDTAVLKSRVIRASSAAR